MKKDIHPEVYDVQVECACGNSFASRSTNKEVKVVICSKCHPFFTGTQKFLDAAGRIDKFNKKFAK